ncbi:MAG: PAS domain-containing protein [Alphaproteobacteria bacterium]|nr:PAS domain-containing protein [Alphaproteobacteria bacterium]
MIDTCTMFDPATMANTRLRRLYDYWDARRGGRDMPARADIDAVEIGWALGDVSLIDVLPDGDFRWRVDGTNLSAFFGCDMGGRKLSQYPFPEFIEKLRARLLAPVRRREPVFETSMFEHGDYRWNYDTLMLPLAADGRNVDMLIQMIDIGRSGATNDRR